MHKVLHYGIVSILAVIVFFSSNVYLRGYLRCEACLGKEIQSPPDSLYQYNLIKKAPFKYRLLFPAIVQGTTNLIGDSENSSAFYYTYKTWSLIFLTAAACLFYYLLTLIGFTSGWALTGSIVFLLMPPVLMAYTVPVHTREDPLAYMLLMLGLIALVKRQTMWFVVITIAGVTCRETLLILPFLFFFYTDSSWIKKFVLAGLPAIVWIALRLLIPKTSYDAWEGLNWNLANPEQVIGFLFITFNVLWLPVLHLFLNYKGYTEEKSEAGLFFRSIIPVLFLILITTFVGGIYNEIRLLYLMAPWMIILALEFLRNHRVQVWSVLTNPRNVMYSLFVVIVFALFTVWAVAHQTQLIKPGKYNIPYQLWIGVSMVYVTITILLVPSFFMTIFTKKTS